MAKKNKEFILKYDYTSFYNYYKNPLICTSKSNIFVENKVFTNIKSKENKKVKNRENIKNNNKKQERRVIIQYIVGSTNKDREKMCVFLYKLGDLKHYINYQEIRNKPSILFKKQYLFLDRDKKNIRKCMHPPSDPSIYGTNNSCYFPSEQKLFQLLQGFKIPLRHCSGTLNMTFTVPNSGYESGTRFGRVLVTVSE